MVNELRTWNVVWFGLREPDWEEWEEEEEDSLSIHVVKNRKKGMRIIRKKNS